MSRNFAPLYFDAPGEGQTRRNWRDSQGRPQSVRKLSPKGRGRLKRAIIALGGRRPRAAYWDGEGWYVSANRQAVPPYSVGDRPWKVWVEE